MGRTVKTTFSLLTMLVVALGAQAVLADGPVHPQNCSQASGKKRTECCLSIRNDCIYRYCGNDPDCVGICMTDYCYCIGQ